MLDVSCIFVLKYPKHEHFFAVPEWNKHLWFISNVYKKPFLRPVRILYFCLGWVEILMTPLIIYAYLWKLQLQQPGQENIRRIKLSPSCPVNHMVWLICRESTFLNSLWICNSHYSMFPIKRTVFLCTVTLVKNTVRLKGNIK